MYRNLLFAIVLFSVTACSTASPQPTEPVAEEIAVPTDTEVPPTATEIPPTPTEMPTAAFTPTVNVPQSGDIIYSTDFSDLRNWDIIKADEDQAGYITDQRSEGLFIVVPEANDALWLYYDETQSDLANVRLESEVELIGGTNYTYISFFCRSTDEGEYVFTLDTGGYWEIGKWHSSFSEYEILVDGASTIINVAKAPNLLVAECNGSSLTIFINGEEIGKAEDDEFETGSIGIGVDTFDIPYAEVMFQGLEVSIP